MDSSRTAVRDVDTRPASAIGRRARLELAFERRRGRTILAHAYAEPPFRVGRVFDMADAAYLIIVCAGPGLFAGDSLEQSVELGPGARAVITSQAALQAHPSAAAAPAAIRCRYRLEAGAELHAHWDPLIPFAGARLDQGVDIDVHPHSRLYWSDAVMSGRVSRGETWRFGLLAHRLSLRIGGSLRYLERYRLIPGDRLLSHPWRAANAHYLATTLIHHERATADVVEACQPALAACDSVRAGIDLLEPGLAVARVMAMAGPPFERARAACRGVALQSIFGDMSLLPRK